MSDGINEFASFSAYCKQASQAPDATDITTP